jgi:ankyrin repeat protein
VRPYRSQATRTLATVRVSNDGPAEGHTMRSSVIDLIMDGCFALATDAVPRRGGGERGDHGTTALHEACEAVAPLDLLRALLAHAATDVNAADDDGTTPLMLAASWHPDPAVVTLLVAAGADVHRRDHAGYSALDLAVERRAPPAVIARVLAAGARADALDGSGWRPLDRAANVRAPVATVRMLVDASESAVTRG